MSKLSEMMDNLSPACDEGGHPITQRQWDELRQQLEQAYADIAGLHDQLEEPQIAQDDYRLNKLELEQLRQQLAALTMQCEKLVKWKHLMSYNDSYFGEHAGDLKRVVYEIDRSMPIRGDK